MKRPIHYRLGKPITASPAAIDIDDDGLPEIIIAADKLYAFKFPSFTLVEGFPVSPTAPAASTPYIFTGKNGDHSIYFGSDDDRLYGISTGGITRENFPVLTGGDVFTSPFSADTDGDGYEELIFGSDDGRIYSIKLGVDGSNLRSLRFFETNGFVSSSPAFLPNDDGTADIIGCSWDHHVYRLSGISFSPIWKKPTGHIIWASPVVADINDDGHYEIIFPNNQLHVIDKDGNHIPPFPLRLGSWTVASPALCDLNSDNKPEIITCADSVYVHTINGESLSGFPFQLQSPVWASPITVDADGDGSEEIIICDYNGSFFVITCEGALLNSCTRTLGKRIVSTPLTVDIDNDGLLEIVIGTFDGSIWIIPTGGKISSWPTFRGGFTGGVLARREIADRADNRHRNPESVSPLSDRLPPPIKHVSHPKISRHTCGRAAFFELSVTIHPRRSLKRGMMYFMKNNTWAPSPLFGDGERFIARFPPYRRFSRVQWYAELTDWYENTVRIPGTGYKSFRVY
jgi:hypothetical protein